MVYDEELAELVAWTLRELGRMRWSDLLVEDDEIDTELECFIDTELES